MKQIHYLVYKTTNLINGKIYIGAHKTSNLNDDYMGSGRLINRAFSKYGKENFKTEILHELESLEEMYSKEAELVNEEFLKRDDVYNLKLGGQGGWDHINSNGLNNINGDHASKARKILSIKIEEDADFREKMFRINSDNLKRAHASGKIKYDTFTGKSHTEETKKKMSESKKGKKIGEQNSQFGTMWIYLPDKKINKKIKKCELSDWVSNGWIQGRKIN